MSYQLVHPYKECLIDYLALRSPQNPVEAARIFLTRVEEGTASFERLWMLTKNDEVLCAFNVHHPPGFSKRFCPLRTTPDIPDDALGYLFEALLELVAHESSPLHVIYNLSKARDFGNIPFEQGWQLEAHGVAYAADLTRCNSLEPDTAGEKFDLDHLLSDPFAGFYHPIWLQDEYKSSLEFSEKLQATYASEASRSGGHGYYLRDEAGEPVAAGLVSVAGDTAYINVLGVVPTARSRGWGRRLHRHLMWAAKGLARSYEGQTDASNLAMRRIFERNGCRQVDEQWEVEPP